jgi:hypothetical protein
MAPVRAGRAGRCSAGCARWPPDMMRSGSQSGPGRGADQQRGQETSTGIAGSSGAAAAGAAHLRRLGRGADLPDFVAMMLATGLRIGECAALRWENVDLNASNGHRHVHGGAAEGPRIKRQIDEKPGRGHARLPCRRGACGCSARGLAPIPCFPAPMSVWRDPSNTQADLRGVHPGGVRVDHLTHVPETRGHADG